jgi:hypothetical protein
MKQILILSLVIFLFLTGCQSGIPKDALTLTPEILAQRQIQTKKYETTEESRILAASAALLQDMGFNIDESETKLGLISSSKMRDATSAAQVAGAVVLAVLTGVSQSVDKEQKMRAAIVTRPVGEGEKYITVRVIFQRTVWNTRGQVTTSESLTDPEIYQEFFDKLSKSIFLEAQEL